MFGKTFTVIGKAAGSEKIFIFCRILISNKKGPDRYFKFIF